MKMALVLGMAGAAGLLGQQSVDAGPLSTFAPLGITGVVSVVLFLWRQETSKKLDKAMALNEELVPLLTRVLDVVQTSNQVHESAAIAIAAANSALTRVPTEETFTRIKVALERSENAWSGTRARRESE